MLSPRCHNPLIISTLHFVLFLRLSCRLPTTYHFLFLFIDILF